MDARALTNKKEKQSHRRCDGAVTSTLVDTWIRGVSNYPTEVAIASLEATAGFRQAVLCVRALVNRLLVAKHLVPSPWLDAIELLVHSNQPYHKMIGYNEAL